MSTIDTDAIQAAVKHYLSPEEPSILACCREFGVSEGSLRRALRAMGVVTRTAAEQKRRKVEDHFSGESAADRLAEAEATDEEIADAAQEDIGDMQNALEVARSCIRRLKEIVETVSDPREVKAVADANEKAMLTIRKIRGLDAPVDFSDWTDAELEILAQSGRMPAGRR